MPFSYTVCTSPLRSPFTTFFPNLRWAWRLLIVVLKTLALRTQDKLYDNAARFWGRIFGISFVMGVATGIPMEFQFGTNWSHFSRFAGGVIGHTLAMEGMFAFFLESAFLGLFLYGEKRLTPRHIGFRPSPFLWVPGFRVTSLSRPMHGCKTLSGMRKRQTARCSLPAFGRLYSILGRGGSMRTT